MKPRSRTGPQRRKTGLSRSASKPVAFTPARATFVSFKPGTAVVLTRPATGKTASRALSARSFPAGSILGLSGAAARPKPGQKPVAVAKVQAGLKAASDHIRNMVAEVAAVFTEEYRITQIELTLSFNADGKFLGFGVGGAASITVTIAPADLAKPK